MVHSRTFWWSLVVVLTGVAGLGAGYLALPDQERKSIHWNPFVLEGFRVPEAIARAMRLRREMDVYYRARGHYPLVSADDGVATVSLTRRPFRLAEGEAPNGDLLNELAADAFISTVFRRKPSWYVTDGQVYVLIGTGPDRDIDIPADLRIPIGFADFQGQWRERYVYDPTNGIKSSGDCFSYGEKGGGP